MPTYNWRNIEQAQEQEYQCGYCDNHVAPSKQYWAASKSRSDEGHIYICPRCSRPTFFDHRRNQTPKPRLGQPISGISKPDVKTLYDEARDCTAAGAYTAAVMACRKILMNLAVDQKAKEGGAFAYYVDYLSDHGFVPPQGKPWVTAIKDRGNDANHQITPMDGADAKLVLDFTSALLRFNYELPSMLQADQEKKAPPSA